jgi:hypothetical protein
VRSRRRQAASAAKPSAEAVELREYFIPDFSHWKEHAQFEAAFARLLNDLRAETTAASAG